VAENESENDTTIPNQEGDEASEDIDKTNPADEDIDDDSDAVEGDENSGEGAE
jgi:hypothetical protein